MQIARNTVVTLRYRVTDAEGNLIDAGDKPLIYLHGGLAASSRRSRRSSKAKAPASRRISASSRRRPLASSMPNW